MKFLTIVVFESILFTIVGVVNFARIASNLSVAGWLNEYKAFEFGDIYMFYRKIFCIVKESTLTEIGDETFVGFSLTEVGSVASAEVGCDSRIPSLPKDTCASLVSIGSSFGLSFNSINDVNCKFIIVL
jgi:hypothetical protein